jgi:NADH-quinone oxidoreductase subunit M
MPNLLLLFLVPFIGSIVVGLYSTVKKRLKWLAVSLSLIPLVVLVVNHSSWLGSHFEYNWFPNLSIHFSLGMDRVSLIFLYLTALVIPIVCMHVDRNHLTHPNLFYALVLFLQGLLGGFFLTQDLVFFTIFWEAMLLPIYFLMHLWGGAKRHEAAIKFIVYMFAGSALMVAAVLALYLMGGTFDLSQLALKAHSFPYAGLIAAIFLLAFAVKTPLFPLHAWLPDAYYQASTSGTILLSALLSKAGIYGIIRIGIGFFPSILKEWSPWLLGLAIAGVLYGALVAWKQNDFKKLLAYSSFSHVNFILIGLFALNPVAQEGAILQAFNHGITITALFIVAAYLEKRLGFTTFEQAQGLASYLPKLCWLTFFFVLSSVALPGTNNFVGELLILYGLFASHPYLTALAGSSIILSVIYMLRWMQKMYFEASSSYQVQWVDLTKKEFWIVVPLIIIILWVGLYPMGILKDFDSEKPLLQEWEPLK